MESHTKTSQRIIIWIIAVTMTIGFIGSYFIIIMQNNEQQQAVDNLQQQQADKYQVDSSAYKVSGDVTELQKVDLVVGTGEEVKPGDQVRVHYKGTVAQTGVKFDSSYDRGEPITFGLNEVIAGWSEGVPGMKVGGKRRLIVPSDKAYGQQELPGIPANSDLVFEVELIAINPAE
ncbi:MAG: FKBP-type peptidyl-prolyl cis-trans isomerase [Candidatus Saccharimonadales bacterium]